MMLSPMEESRDHLFQESLAPLVGSIASIDLLTAVKMAQTTKIASQKCPDDCFCYFLCQLYPLIQHNGANKESAGAVCDF